MRKGALEKIGRNLILFQHIEHALKGLITLGSISYSSTSGLRPSSYQSQSLGLVAVAFVQRHLSSGPPSVAQADPANDEVLFQSSFHIEGTAAVDLADIIKRAVPDRNRLAHLLITDFDLSVESGLEDACQWLDTSHAENSRLLEMLRDHHRSVREAFHTIASFLQSDEGKAELFLPDYQNCSVIQLMLGTAKSSEGEGGWMSIAEGVNEMPRSTVQETLERLGKKSLTELMVASRLFEIRAEESGTGGTRMFYRLARKPVQ